MQVNFPGKIEAKKKMTTNNGFHIIITIHSTRVIIKKSWKSYHLVTSPLPSETAFLASRAKNMKSDLNLMSSHAWIISFHNWYIFVTQFLVLLSLSKAFNPIPTSPEKQCSRVMEKKKDKERKENNVFAQIAVNLICKFS